VSGAENATDAQVEAPPPKGSRRRGEALENDLLDAAWDELSTSGWSNLRMERVAARAGTGKTSLYSRWPTKFDLVRAVAARAAQTGGRAVPIRTGALRSDLLALLDSNGRALEGPFGELLRGMVAESKSVVQAFGTHFTEDAAIHAVVAIVAAAEERGELALAARAPRELNLGIVLNTHHFMVNGAAATHRQNEDIVDIWLRVLGA